MRHRARREAAPRPPWKALRVAAPRPSKRVATLLGLRYDRPVELRVPQATCELLASTAKPADDAQPWRCQAQGNAVKAHVDVRLGSRWLVRVTELHDQPTGDQGVRITLPDAGTEMLLPLR